MWRTFSFALAAVALVGLAACGGGASGDDNDDDDDDGGVQPVEFRGFFIDDTVEALQFQTDNGTSGVTDEYGTYTCEPNEPVTFLVDGITLGTAECLVRVVPGSFGAPGLNIARLLQSLDTAPDEPGIDLTGIDLPATPIDFNQGNDSFANDPAVQAAVNVPGARGFLVSASDAQAAIAAGTGTVFDATDVANKIFYPVSTLGPHEPCLARLNADGSAENVCRDDIDADPANAVQTLSWSLDGGVVVLDEPTGQERVTVQRLGTTGNRFSVDVVAECLVCDPNVEPAFEIERQTLIAALPLAFADLQGQALMLSGADPASSLAFTLQANGTGTMTTPVNATFVWDVDDAFPDLLRLRQSGAPGTQLFYHQLILLSGDVATGTWAALLGQGTDSGTDGVVDADEFADTRVLQAVDLLSPR